MSDLEKKIAVVVAVAAVAEMLRALPVAARHGLAVAVLTDEEQQPWKDEALRSSAESLRNAAIAFEKTAEAAAMRVIAASRDVEGRSN